MAVGMCPPRIILSSEMPLITLNVLFNFSESESASSVEIKDFSILMPCFAFEHLQRRHDLLYSMLLISMF